MSEREPLTNKERMIIILIVLAFIAFMILLVEYIGRMGLEV